MAAEVKREDPGFWSYYPFIGTIKALGYKEGPQFTLAEIKLLNQAGIQHDSSRYMWSEKLLKELLKPNTHVYSGTLAQFVDLVKRHDGSSTKVPGVLCLIHAAFLDAGSFWRDKCGDTPIVLPEEIYRYMTAMKNIALDPETSWPIYIQTKPEYLDAALQRAVKCEQEKEESRDRVLELWKMYNQLARSVGYPEVPL